MRGRGGSIHRVGGHRFGLGHNMWAGMCGGVVTGGVKRGLEATARYSKMRRTLDLGGRWSLGRGLLRWSAKHGIQVSSVRDPEATDSGPRMCLSAGGRGGDLADPPPPPNHPPPKTKKKFPPGKTEKSAKSERPILENCFLRP